MTTKLQSSLIIINILEFNNAKITFDMLDKTSNNQYTISRWPETQCIECSRMYNYFNNLDMCLSITIENKEVIWKQ